MNRHVATRKYIRLGWLAGLVLLGLTSAVRAHGPVVPGVMAAPLIAPADCLPKDPPPPVVKIRVRVPAQACPGEAIEYCLCVENCSTAEAHHVVVKNALPANATFVRSDPAPSQREPELQWQLGTIGGGASREIKLVLMPTNKEDVKNCARVQFEHGQCVVTRQAALPPGVIPPTLVPIPPEPPLGKEPPDKGKEPDSGKPGVKPPVRPLPPVITTDGGKLGLTFEGHKQQYVNLPSRYFLTVTNPGKEKATTLLLTVTLPAKATFVSASDKGQFLENQVAWFLGALEPGARKTVELVVRATEAGELCFKAATLADKDLRATAEACTDFRGVSALTVDLADRDDPLLAGAKTSYAVTIRNQGSAPVTNLKLRALIPTGLTLERTQPIEFQKGEPAATGQWIAFVPLPKLDPNAQVTYELNIAAGRQLGPTRLHIELDADGLERGPIVEEENTTIFDDQPEVRPAPMP